MTTRAPRRLSRLQETLLWIVEENAPASVSDCAAHAMADAGAARSALLTLERRGLLDRTYTGHHCRGAQFAYVTTATGSAAAEEPELAPGECDLCGKIDGHYRMCILSPGRPSRA